MTTSNRLRIGIVHASTDQGMTPQQIAVEVEQRGFASLFFTEHTHIPVARTSPWPGDGDMPASAPRQHDLIVALTAAATATSTLGIGSAVCLLPQRDTISAAKAFASVDYLSEGRLSVGVGAGWNLEELRDHGVDPVTRRDKLDEQIAAMRLLWTKDEASFAGKFVAFEPSWSWPKPVQPRLPVLLGAPAGRRTFSTVIDHGDGWMPFPGPDLGRDIAVLRQQWRDAGRAGNCEVVVFGVPPEPAALEAVRAAGADEALLLLDNGQPELAQPTLDAWAQLWRA